MYFSTVDTFRPNLKITLQCIKTELKVATSSMPPPDHCQKVESCIRLYEIVLQLASMTNGMAEAIRVLHKTCNI